MRLKILSQDFSFSNFFSPDVGDYSDDTDVTVTLDLRNKGSSNDQEEQRDEAKGIKQAM